MTIDFGLTYQPPDVYAEENPAPFVGVVGIAPAAVGIVGPSIGYRIYTEVVTLTGTAVSALAKLGIITSSVVVKDASGATIAGAEYTVAQAVGADGSLTTDPYDNPTTLARSGSGSAIPSGSQVYVSYQYRDAAYFQPKRYTDFEVVKADLGSPLDVTSGVILSPLSLAAKIAFDNGAREIVLCAAVGTATAVTRTDLSNALAKLIGISDLGIVVSLPVGIIGTTGSPADTANVATDLKTHCVNSSDDYNFRIGIIGYEEGNTVDPATTAVAASSKRLVLMAPYKYEFYNGYTNTTLLVAGYYAAAGLAGLLSRNNVQEPATRKILRGFSAIPASVRSTMTKSVKNGWAVKGVTVVEQEEDPIGSTSRLVIRHGLTTDISTVHTREISLVRCSDALVSLFRRTMNGSGLIGSAIDRDAVYRVKGLANGILGTAVGAGIINAYTAAQVRQSETDPTRIEVRFSYKPTYPLNFITVTWSIDTTTGEIAPITSP